MKTLCMPMIGELSCPLCLDAGPKSLKFRTRRSGRAYWLCEFCSLIFMDPANLPDVETERRVYEHHQNSPEHAGYVQFLRRVLDPALKYIQPGMTGIDYGCGPGPTLSVLLQSCGIACHDYDPIFFPGAPAGPFDFIFATECLEHFHHPHRELQRISALLRPEGFLFIMTELWPDGVDFANWYYKCDPTHVSFFNRRSVQYLCEQFGYAQRACNDQRVILLQRSAAR